MSFHFCPSLNVFSTFLFLSLRLFFPFLNLEDSGFLIKHSLLTIFDNLSPSIELKSQYMTLIALSALLPTGQQSLNKNWQTFLFPSNLKHIQIKAIPPNRHFLWYDNNSTSVHHNSHPFYQQGIEYADCITCSGLKKQKQKEVFSKFGVCRVSLHCYYSQVHYDPIKPHL